MPKHSLDALQLSTYTRRSHFIYGIFENFLVLIVTLVAIVTISSVFIDEFSSRVDNGNTAEIINYSLDNQ
ncbi:hypothetical protein [uncultured Bartonella sp.]|uniref:hypothetical protein n=1 Tax=uncultured Bartonella sp. TaxID=104108 RepID=UPI0025D7A52C|nr:hypothetical protein [uncultured Bartonella sp.]